MLQKIDRAIDRSNMLADYALWAEKGIEVLNYQFEAERQQDEINIFCAGMGASAAPAEIFVDNGYRLKIVQNHILPRDIGSKDTLIAVSLSGNTEETVLALKAAIAKGIKCIGISNGGKIKEICLSNSIPHLAIPKMLTSRSSFPIIASALALVLSKLYGQTKILEEMKQWYDSLSSLSKRLLNEETENQSISIASFMLNATHLTIYHSPYTAGIARRMRNVLSENAKARSTITDIMDVQHDGITCWENDYGSKLILLPSQRDDEVISSRFSAVADVVKSLGFGVSQISSTGQGLQYLLNIVYTMDIATIYLALMRRLDPSVNRAQELLRRRLEGKQPLL